MSTRSDLSYEGLNESHINDTERSKWFSWRWKLSDDIRFRMAVMKEWSIDVLWWVDQGEFSEWILLNISAKLTWWIGSINQKCGWCDVTMVMWPVNENKPTRHGCGVKVSCLRATCYQQSFFKFSSQFFPSHCWPVLLYFYQAWGGTKKEWEMENLCGLQGAK